MFETVCSADCELYFMMVSDRTCEASGADDITSVHVSLRRPPQDFNRKSTTVVESWEGSKSRQSFSHSVSRNVSVTYTWAFQRTNRASDVSGKDAENQ